MSKTETNANQPLWVRFKYPALPPNPKRSNHSFNFLQDKMATARLSDPIFRPVSDRFLSSRRPTTSRPAFISLSPSKQFKTGRSSSVVESKTEKSSSKWPVRMSLVEPSPPKSTLDVKRLVDFLYEDLPHLFDDQGIDRTAYDERVKFRDPITKHDTITGYLFNIAMLKKIFTPDFLLHWVKPVCFSLS